MKLPTNYEAGVTIHSEAGKVTGTLTVPKAHSLQSLLSAPEPFLKLSEVRLDSRPDTLSFLSIHRRAVRFVIPFHPDDPRVAIHEYATATTLHRVICMLADGEVEGNLEVPAHIRLSDYLEHHSGFFPMRNCRARIPAHTPGHGRMAEEKVPLLFVNSMSVIGVFETPVASATPEEAEPELALRL